MKLLTAPDTYVGYLNGQGVFKSKRNEYLIEQAIIFLLTADKDAVNEAGMAYALESGNCFRCGRQLTEPASIHRGLGPDCAVRVPA